MKPTIYSIGIAALVAAILFGFAWVCLAPYLMPVVGRQELVRTNSASYKDIKRVELQNDNGPVRVQAVSGNDVRVDVVVRGRPLTAKAAQGLDQSLEVPVDIGQADGVLAVRTAKGRKPADVEVEVAYTLDVPMGANLILDVGNGNVTVSGQVGGMLITGQNADVEVLSPRGPVSVKTMNGRVRLTGVPEGADVTTTNGNVYAHMSGGPLTAQTSNGAIVARVAGEAVSACNLTTLNGGITVVLGNDASAKVEAGTEHGKVRCDWPLAGIDEGKTGLQHIAGAIGTGRIPLRLGSVNGNIWVARDTP